MGPISHQSHHNLGGDYSSSSHSQSTPVETSPKFSHAEKKAWLELVLAFSLIFSFLSLFFFNLFSFYQKQWRQGKLNRATFRF